ncbi:hypothetical protein [Paenibacillus sp. Root444D2]|uniref:hypothetical protein n=1 Tax=Paenibacillus sp. Root444D2 TaxID=1736538 RepID=UPI00070B484E|nr:hypothetical protein [Paenibacillus sp. Root444D2]KQX69293.1 hypothetical protein ASD40_01980 [Paenibacillus sp. Root444D2]
MKFNIQCMKCLTEGIKDENKVQELTDERVYHLTCDAGHETVIIVEHHVYELLFEMGIYALTDGYAREAVANFAAAIERFHEFSINVFAAKSLKSTSYMEDFPKSWKELSKQSERQLGAYIMMYLTTFKKNPELIPQKKIEFRNDVIHKGKFPTLNEATKYANLTFEYIKNKLVEMKKELDDEVTYVHDKNLRDYIIKHSGNGKHIVHWAELMTFRSTRPVEEIEQKTFEESMNQLKQYRSFYN